MKKIMLVLTLVAGIGMALVGCSAGMTADYTTTEFEVALNNGEDVTGKTVEIEVTKLDPNSKLGYNIQTGEHLNFVSAEHPGVEEGDIIIVKVERVGNLFGSFLITYTK
jgi:hypothetical protein